MKKCSKCGTDKPLGEFSPSNKYNQGVNHRCRECARIVSQESKDRLRHKYSKEGYLEPRAKVCRRCHVLRDPSEYSKHLSAKDGLAVTCKLCRSIIGIARYDTRKEHIKIRGVVVVPADTIKRCCTCKQKKLISEFGSSISSLDGYGIRCSECLRKITLETSRKRAQANVARGFVEVDRKACAECGETRPASDFHINRAQADGLSGSCKRCAIKRARDHYRANKGEHYKNTRTWVAANKDTAKKYKQKWKSKNKEAVLLAGREYMAKTKQERRRKHLERLQVDPQYVADVRMRGRRARSKRRARERGDYTVKQWATLREMSDNKCLRCGKHSKLTVDHVVALMVGGSNYWTNLQPLCLSCNVSKGTKFIDYRPWTMDLDEIGLGA